MARMADMDIDIDISFVESLDDSPAGAVGVAVRPGLEWPAAAASLIQSLGPGFAAALEREKFTGKPGSAVSYDTGRDAPHTVVALGLGSDPGPEQYRRAAGMLGRRSRRAASAALAADEGGRTREMAEGFLLSQYSFTAYQSEPEPAVTETLFLVGEAGEAEEAAVETARINAEAVMFARDLVNTPARDKSPEEVARLAAEMAGPLGLRVVEHDREDLERGGFGGVLGVAAGSGRPPRLLEIWHEPEGAEAFAVLAGKGITFDSGGLSLKPASGMETMKTDMSGAAAVLGAMQIIARRGIGTKVLGLIPLTDNMPGPLATKPGDVLTTRNGKTIEVLNTDAEGRLVLADALALGVEHNPDVIVDIATLTGACMVALGLGIAGAMGTSDELVRRIMELGAPLGERFWHLPLPEDYRKQVESPIADMKNIGGKWAGALTAGLILSEFAGDVPWAHLDIAGPRTSEEEHYRSQGATGFGALTLAALAEDLAERGASFSRTL